MGRMTGLHLHSERKARTADLMVDLKADRPEQLRAAPQQQEPRYPVPVMPALLFRQPDPETSFQSVAGPARSQGRNRGGVCVQLS